MTLNKHIANHVRDIPRSGIRDFFELVAKALTQLLGAAALKLEQAAADGNLDARRAAEHVATAGAIYYGEGQ